MRKRSEKLICAGLIAISCLLLSGFVPTRAQDFENVVGLWTFNENEGEVVADSSGNGLEAKQIGCEWADGKFEMFLVPLGVYDVVIELEGSYPRVLKNVEVRGDIIQNLGTIVYCPKDDRDEDGYVLSKDCNDEDSSINPGAKEVCDGKDNDCDDAIDEDLFRECDTGMPGACSKGEQKCVQGRWYTCKEKVTPKPEELNNIDDDCDGIVDEGCQ